VSSPEVQKQLQYFLTTFDQTDDFFYYYLYAQLFLITTYHQHRLNLSDPTTKSIKIRIQKYLNSTRVYNSSATPCDLDQSRQKGHEDLFL